MPRMRGTGDQKMKLGTAIDKVIEMYKRAKDNPQIKDPVAWALYKTWRIADSENKRKVDRM